MSLTGIADRTQRGCVSMTSKQEFKDTGGKAKFLYPPDIGKPARPWEKTYPIDYGGGRAFSGSQEYVPVTRLLPKFWFSGSMPKVGEHGLSLVGSEYSGSVKLQVSSGPPSSKAYPWSGFASFFRVAGSNLD